MIYISTDYVFSGRRGEAPYKNSAAPEPPNVYGRTKLEGERAVLDVCSSSNARNGAVVLRVPVLYGACDEPKESAVNVLMSSLWASQKLGAADPNTEVDDWALRYPTNTADVGRVCRDISDLYRSSENRDSELPQILQFSSEDCMTKWQIVQTFAEITGLPLDNLTPSKPQDEPSDGVVRPYDCHLDTSALKELGVDVSTVGFREWWYVFVTYDKIAMSFADHSRSKELGVFQR